MAGTMPSCSSGWAVGIRSIRDHRVGVEHPEQGAGGAWQEPSLQPLAVRLIFFTLRDGRIRRSSLRLGFPMEPRTDLLRGTMDLLILKALTLETMHGLAISRDFPQYPNPWGLVNAGWYGATPDYFAALWIDLFKGRPFVGVTSGWEDEGVMQ
jgi:hypothetical protein